MMKRFFLTALLLLSVSAWSDVYVRGYYNSNGTYVSPHYRSSPNSTALDNWSTKGNTNPYTGKMGTRNPSDSVWTSPSPDYKAKPYFKKNSIWDR